MHKESARIQPVENLIEKLVGSEWPMIHYSLNVEALAATRPDLNVPRIVEQLKLRLWEPHGKQESKFGRIALLRLKFFTTLLNGKARVAYLNYLLEKSPDANWSLIAAIEYFASPTKREDLLKVVSDYRAQKNRAGFQVIDGKSE